MNKPWLGPVWNLSLEEGAQSDGCLMYFREYCLIAAKVSCSLRFCDPLKKMGHGSLANLPDLCHMLSDVTSKAWASCALDRYTGIFGRHTAVLGRVLEGDNSHSCGAASRFVSS